MKLPYAVFIGYQEGLNEQSFPLFNIEGPHRLSGSTVSKYTLDVEGIKVLQCENCSSYLPDNKTAYCGKCLYDLILFPKW